MRWYSRLGLKGKFFLFTSLIVIAICAGLFFFIERILRGYLQSEMQRQASAIAGVLQDQLSDFFDPARVQVSAERLLLESPEISRITVYHRVGGLMTPFIAAESTDLPNNTQLYTTAVSRRTPFRFEFKHREKEYWEFAYPILIRGTVVGLTAVTLNFSQFKGLISAVRAGTLLVLLVGLIVMLLTMNIYVGLTIRRPLAEIVSAMNEVKQSRFDARVKPRGEDEIGMLAEDFNTMAAALGEAQSEIMRQNRMLEKRVDEAIAELRTRNLELFQAQDELRRASRLATAGQVAAMLAHDLGSPLSSISGHLQLMLENPSQTPEEKDRIRLLLSQVERLSDTIRNFLSNVSGLETRFQDCDLNALLQHVVELARPLLTGHKIETVLEMDSRLPHIKADSNQLQQLFLNLFSNAMDAMKEGGILKVSTRYLPESQTAEVKVSDTGQGMSPEHLKNLFRPFFSTKEFGKGTGLGLAICKEIVKAHGGQIKAESRQGEGTEFTLLFPVANLSIEKETYEKAESVNRG